MITDISLSDESVKNQLRTLYLDGKNLKEILAILNIPKGTFDAYYWTNKYALRDFMLSVKKEKMLLDAERTSQKILDMEATKKDTKLLALQLNESQFLRETQGKELGYTKRTEQTGANGEQLAVNVVSYTIPKPIETTKLQHEIDYVVKDVLDNTVLDKTVPDKAL